MSAARERAEALGRGVLPTATWAAFQRALDQFRRDGVPDPVSAAGLSGQSGARQVVQSLRVLGFVGNGGVAQLGLHQLVRRNTGVVAALAEIAPSVVAAVRAGLPPDEVARAFAVIPAPSDAVARRFRSFLLSACTAEGIDVSRYKRLGSSAAPSDRPSRAALTVVRNRLGQSSRSLAGAQLRREFVAYENALESALASGRFEVLDQLSERLAVLRAELNREAT